jgi:ribosome-binding factor A
LKDHRSLRLNEQFKREISAILARKVRDPRVGHLLITEAVVTSDLWVARVYFRLLDEGRDPAEVLEGLEAAAPFVRKELGKILRIRRIPELRFHYDTTIDSASRIEKVLREVLPHEDGGDTGTEEEPSGDGSEPDPGGAEGEV